MSGGDSTGAFVQRTEGSTTVAIDQQPPQYPPMPYQGPPGPPPGYMPYAYVVPTSGAATASLVLSLLGIITFGFLAIFGVIFGHIGASETRSGHRGGHGMAIAGLIIGWLQVGGWLLFWVFVGIGSA